MQQIKQNKQAKKGLDMDSSSFTSGFVGSTNPINKNKSTHPFSVIILTVCVWISFTGHIKVSKISKINQNQ